MVLGHVNQACHTVGFTLIKHDGAQEIKPAKRFGSHEPIAGGLFHDAVRKIFLSIR